MEPVKKPTILIVEDDPILVKMYTAKFTTDGFTVLSASDGVEGLNMALTQPVDCMILDVMMPKMTGVDMLTKLRADEKGKNIPTLVLTNLPQKEEAMKLQELGIKEYLVKANLTPSEIVAKVKQHLAVPTS